MRRLISLFLSLAFALLCQACSSSSSGGSSGAPPDCGQHDVTRYDGTTCAAATVTGLCTRSLGRNSATLEFVCAAGPDGAFYLVSVNGDTYLSGDGWTFGPRAFGKPIELYPVEPESLSTADQARCRAAQSHCSPVGG
jgi:hypothetical protein